MLFVGGRWSARAILLGGSAVLGLYAGCGVPDFATPWYVESGPACVATEDCPDISDLCRAKACVSNQCIYSTVVADDGDACTVDACDPETGVSHAPVDPNDNNACTIDACDPATGPSHTDVDPNDNNECTVDACDPATGPTHDLRPDEDDQNACTKDACDPATGGYPHEELTPEELDDTNACTADSCDPELGPQHISKICDPLDLICTFNVCNPANAACEAKKQLLVETFSTSTTGWTLDPEWQIGAAMASANGDPANDHSVSADNGIAGVVIGGNPSTTQHDAYYLTSPPIDLRSIHIDVSVSVSYWRVLNSTAGMVHTVEVFDGTTWNPVWQSNGEVADATWTNLKHDVSEEKYRIANFRVRFGFSVGAGAGDAGSWNIDDVNIVPGDFCQ